MPVTPGSPRDNPHSHRPRTHTAYLGIGSNVGDRHAHLDLAAAGLGKLGTLRLSPVYETAPVGPQDQGPFLNQAAELVTALSPEDLLSAMRAIEAQAGREPVERRRRWGPRVLDLDLLLYDDAVLDTPKLVVPHPHLHERWFVLRPLCDLAPDTVHPTLHRTIRDLLDELPDHHPDHQAVRHD